MKFLLLFLFVGGISATLHTALEEATNDVLEEFKRSLSESTPLHEALGIEDNDVVRKIESDIRKELIEHLKEVFSKALKQIKEAIDKKEDINQEAVDKLKYLYENLHELEIEEHEVEGFKILVKDYVRKILEKMGLVMEKRDTDEYLANSMFPDLDFRNFFLRIKEMILEKMNVGSLKQALVKVVGQASDGLCRWLTSRGKEKVLNFFDRFLESDPLEDEVDRKRRSTNELHDEIREYFDRMELDFKEKFGKFKEWVKNLVETGLGKSRSKIENVRRIAHELLNKSKEVSKEVAAEALEYLHKYKDELGSLYEEVREKVMKKLMEYTD